MMKLAVISVLLCVLAPAPALSDNTLPLSCPQALEQLITLNTGVPVYKLTAPDHRHFLDDADRPLLLDDVQAPRLARRCRQVDRRVEAARDHDRAERRGALGRPDQRQPQQEREQRASS